MSKVAVIEETHEMPLPDFVSKGELWRRNFMSIGGDWAYFLVAFLRGQREREIQPSEITETELYLRSTEMERRALRMVCEPDYPGEHSPVPLPDEKRHLWERDHFLMNYVDGKNLGHADLVAQLNAIPAQVQERQQFDRMMFAKTYEEPKLFSWLFGR